MPRKTKKEKIIASYKRKIRLLEKKEFLAPSSTSFKEEKNIIIKKQSKAKELSIAVNLQDEAIKKHFFSDLKRSLFLVALIISIEIGLYFASINNYFK